MLRPFTIADAPQVQKLAGDRDVADMTDCIPHPYTQGLAERWILSLERQFILGFNATLAVETREDRRLTGCIELEMTPQRGDRTPGAPPQRVAELAYWFGKPFWGRGYCTEAARAVIRLGFRDLGLNRIFAYHFTRNPASGRVMQKLGMTVEQFVAQHPLALGKREDVIVYGVLRSEWESQQAVPIVVTMPTRREGLMISNV